MEELKALEAAYVLGLRDASEADMICHGDILADHPYHEPDLDLDRETPFHLPISNTGIRREDVAEEGFGDWLAKRHQKKQEKGGGFIVRTMKKIGEKQEKKREEEARKNRTDLKSRMEDAPKLPDNFIKLVESELKRLLRNELNDSANKKMIQDALKEYNEEYKEYPNSQYSYNELMREFGIKIFEKYDKEVSFIVFDGEQDLRISIGSNIIDNMEKEIRKFCNEKFDITIHISTGDGDEGCIYFQTY